ncbi:MAG: DUF1294 domain-containing protein [Oleispira sp.]
MPKHKKLLLSFLVILLPTSYFLGYTPLLLSLIILIFSLLAYMAYAKDKAAATRDAWRVPEKTLHFLSLFFGWPGAIFAQERLRHKTKKLNFRVVFWITVLVNICIIYSMHTPEGFKLVKYSMNNVERIIVTEVRSDKVREILLLLTKIEKY